MTIPKTFEPNPKPGHELLIFGRPLTVWILLALVVGTAAGLALNGVSADSRIFNVLVEGVFKVGGEIFFSLLKMLVVPVVFVSLVCGVGALDDVKKVGRIGAKALGLYVLTTALAVALALIGASLVQPGMGFNLSAPAHFTPGEPPGLAQVIVDLIPANPIKAMADANMLQIITLSLLFGASLSLAKGSGRKILGLFNDLNEVLMKLVTLVMFYAPIGVFCLLAGVFARQGFIAFAPLAKYLAVVMAVLFFHVAVVYTSILRFMGGLRPITFFRKFQEVMVFAFSTSSSNATLPLNLEVTEKQLGVSNSVASFTLPLGATINMDGTAIMQGVATLFIAQAYGLDIGFGGCLTVIATATMASIGTAGVPGIGLVTLAMVLKQVNLPVEGIGLIVGVDRLLDMARTVVNVSGDAVVTCVVAKGEGQLDEKTFYV